MKIRAWTPSLILAGLLFSSLVYSSSGSKQKSACKPGFLCLGLKYVVYRDEGRRPVIPAVAVDKNLATINSIWSQCGIGFELESYVEADPGSYGLGEVAEFEDLDRARRAFADPSRLLVVTTRSWLRSGDLGRSPANAWTKMPGGGVYGVVVEGRVGAFSNIVAHELGHYLGLSHEGGVPEYLQEQEASSAAVMLGSNPAKNIMSRIIERDSKTLTSAQCETARNAVRQWWSGALR